MKLRTSLLGCALLSLSGTAVAQGYEPANSLPWPLWRQDDPSIPREALGNAFGEYQFFTGGAFLHSGIDIRGRDGDIVKLVADGNVWMTISYMADRCAHESACRIYVKGTDDRYVYYYSHLQLHPESEITAETRSAIIAATHWNSVTGDMTEQPGTEVTAGAVLSRIGPFGSNWPHLHFAVIDSTQNWDAVNPLTALARSAGPLTIIDDERPEITALEFVRDGSEASVSAPDACTPISGAVDIAATMRDSFYTTDPEPFPVQGGILSTFGVYEAEYRVRRSDGGAPPLEGTWYRMDRAPLECAGPDRGNDCPFVMDVNDFALHSFFQPSSGIKIAQPYTPTLFSTTRSESNFVGVERHVHLLTNTWGENGRWDTVATGNGWYQVSAIAKDLDGNEQALSRFVAVQNGGTLSLPGEVYVRDNPNDVGAIPSTLGGHPFWTSPDIFVMPAGVVPGIGDTPPETLLEPDTAYDVYVRVKNDSCADVPAAGVQVYSANPAMIVDASQWVHITPAGTYQPPGGTSVPAGGTVLFGPFSWTPTADEASSNLGHRCMLAKLDAASDPVGTADVPQNDNIAQRNLQFGLTSFSLGNPGSKIAKIGTELRCNGFPVGANGALLELRVPYHPALHAAWLGTPGAVVTIAGGQLVVRFTRCNVRLPGVDLKAFEVLPASFKAIAPPNVPGTWTIDLSQTSNGVLGGGMSFLAKSP